MRKYVVIALVLLVAGVGVSLYLIPTASEVTALQTKDAQTLDLSGVNVEAEYHNGNRSFPIVAAMADKKVAAGDRPAAVALLEEYVKANASDVNGRKKLAEQYQLSGNQAGFNAQIEFIAAAAPTETNLQLLSNIYNAAKEYQKQVVVLKQIVEVTKGEKPQAFVDLATIQVALGDTDGALQTVETLSAKHPRFTSYPMTRIMVSVLAEKGDADKAFAAAKGWMEAASAAPVPTAATPAPEGSASPAASVAAADDKPKELADLVNILHYSGHAEKAIALAQPYTAMLERSPDLVLAYVNAHITAGKSDEAYAVLKQIDDAGKMIAALYPPYLDLTLKREDVAAAQTIAGKLDVATFNEEQALNTLEIARAHGAEDVLKTLTTRFGDAVVLKDKPVLDAVIAILTGDKAQDTKIETALNLKLTSTQRIRLAESCARASKTACFDAMVKQYPTLDKMAPEQIAEYAQLFIIAGRAGEIVDGVGTIANAQGSAAVVQKAYTRVASAAGRADVMHPWLQANANHVPVAQLQELFYLANDRKHGEVASDIAERLYARDPSPMNRDIMVSAYLGANAYDKAVPLLRAQVKENGANDGLYLATLSKLARKDKDAKKELTDYAQVALQSQRGDAKAQLNYAYILINNGKKDVVIPYAKNFAQTQGGEWKKLYGQLTAKPGVPGKPATKLTREQMVEMAASPSISRESKRQMAFNLLSDGHKADAITVFKDLAKDKGPDSQEVKDLLYLWGGKIKGEELAWVKARAASANAYDKKRWGDLINHVADDATVMQYVGSTPDALHNPDLRKKYFRTLAASGNRANYETAMQNWVAQTTDVAALLDYATIGQNAGFREAAINGYERVLALDPNNSRALSQMAALDFAKGKFSTAEARLNRFAATERAEQRNDETSAEAHFYKAQLLRRQGKKAEANAEFNFVLQLAAKNGATTPDALSRVYTSQFHLGQHAQGKAGFEHLLQQHPNDKGVLADYMSVLIEYNYLDDATRIANQYDKNSPYYQKRSGLTGHAKNTASVERWSGGREMKITFAEPIHGRAPIDLKAAKTLGWLERSTLGYDSISLSAKPGYVVRFIPTANEQFAVVAAAQPQYSPHYESQRQQQLRLQLLYARIEQNAGQADKAAQRLAALDYYFPNDPQLLAYKASIASSRGDNDQAIDYLQQAKRIAPENEDLSLQEQNIRRIEVGKSYAKLDHEYRALGDHREHITTASGVLTQGRTEFGLVAQNNFLDAENIRRAKDGTIKDRSVARQRGELFVAQNFAGGTRAQASLYANNKDLGAGLSIAFNNAVGRTELLGEYQRPYWDFVEAVYENTTRDRVGFKHFSTLQPGTTLGLETSFNRYTISEADEVAETALLRLNLVQQIQPETAHQPYLGIGYGFDGEYRSGKPETRLDGSGTSYYLLPIQTREVHALTGIYRDHWSAHTQALFIGGVAYDRIHGGASPLAEARIDHDLTQSLQVGARARYAQETNNTDNKALNLGADVLYKF